jgi:hypothetical protein
MKLFSSSFQESNDPVIDNIRLPFPGPYIGLWGRTQAGVFILGAGNCIGGSGGGPGPRSPRQIAETMLLGMDAKTALAVLSAEEWSPIRREIVAARSRRQTAERQGKVLCKN